MDAAVVCCKRCPEASAAITRQIARRRLLKSAVFHPQAPVAAIAAFQPSQGSIAHAQSATLTAGRDEAFESQQILAADPDSLIDTLTGQRAVAGAARGSDDETLPGAAIHAGSGLLPVPGQLHGRNDSQNSRHVSAAGPAPTNLYQALTGWIVDVGPQVLVIDDGAGERRFALTADSRAWCGAPLDPAALKRGDFATIRLLPNRPGVADRIWANIGRVTGTIVGRESDRLLVAESRNSPPQAVIIPARARVRVQVRYPNLRTGYLLDIIGIRRDGYLEGVLPTSPQPSYRADLVQKDQQPPARSESILGSATWHDSVDEPFGALGVCYPAIDPAASCREDSLAGYGPGAAPAFRDLPYLAVGSALNVRNECTGISCTLPVTGCAPMTRLFNDRCVACANSPRGRVADLTVASFIALGGELDDGCFNTTLTIGR